MHRRLGSQIPIFSLLVLIAASGQADSQTKIAQQPTMPPAVRAACDAAFSTARATPGVSVRRRVGTFRDETLREPVSGCGLAISGSFKRAERTGDAVERLRDALMGQDWTEMPAYGADGTDGTSFAFRKGAVSCLVRGTWDGGADGDPALPAEDWYKVAMFCTSPIFPETR